MPSRVVASLASLALLVTAVSIGSCAPTAHRPLSACESPRNARPAPGSSEMMLPRCAEGDRACGPVPFERVCLEESGYDPKGRRIVDGPLRDPRRKACAHDGECMNTGCGYACDSVRVPAATYLCMGRLDVEARLKDRYCGCVDGLCQWFAQ